MSTMREKPSRTSIAIAISSSILALGVLVGAVFFVDNLRDRVSALETEKKYREGPDFKRRSTFYEDSETLAIGRVAVRLREAGSQVHVRRHEPGFRAMAGAQGDRLRATPDGSPETGTRPELRGGKRPRPALGRYAQKDISQYVSDLARPV